MKVSLPWPPKQLTPNHKRSRHWRTAVLPTRLYRSIAFVLAKEAKLAVAAGDMPVMLKITFYPPDKRRRDADGMVGSIKAGLDGIADALKVDDYRFRAEYHFADPEKPGRVEVEIL